MTSTGPEPTTLQASNIVPQTTTLPRANTIRFFTTNGYVLTLQQ
jgi:hypothetical protein